MPDKDGFPTASDIAKGANLPKPVSPETPYGFCPECYKPGKSRERRPNGNDTCVDGHVYPSAKALSPKRHMPPAAQHAPTPAHGHPVTAPDGPPVMVPPGLPPGIKLVGLTPEQEKAIGLILSGHTFLFVVMRPTATQPDGSAKPCEPQDATGCDFLTCLHGDKDTLIGAKEHLPGVIDRLYAKRGML